MLPMPPVEESTIGVNEARSISRIRSSYSLFLFGSGTRLGPMCVSHMRGPLCYVKNLPFSKRWHDAQKISPVTP